MKSGIATVQQEAIDLNGDGKVGLYKIRVVRIRILSGDGEWTDVYDGSSGIAQKMANFIAAYCLDHPGRLSAEIAFDLGEDPTAG